MNEYFIGQRPLAHLYDNKVVYSPLWNIPPVTKFHVGDRVKSLCGVVGRVGVITSIIESQPTSSLRCRPHAYYVKLDSVSDRVLLMEDEITKHDE